MTITLYLSQEPLDFYDLLILYVGTNAIFLAFVDIRLNGHETQFRRISTDANGIRFSCVGLCGIRVTGPLKAWSHECRIVPHRPTHQKQIKFNAWKTNDVDKGEPQHAQTTLIT